MRTAHAPYCERADVQMRGKLAQLNGRLTKVETQVQLIEQTLSSVDQQDAEGNPVQM